MYFMKIFVVARQNINYKDSASIYDEHTGSSRNCGNHPPEEKSTVSTNVGNLYGSTPQLRHHVATSNLGKSTPSRSIGRAIDNFRADPHSVNQLEFHDFGDGFEPGRIIDDYVGPAMELVRGAFYCKFRQKWSERFCNV